jgi:hypothetical protein
MQSLLGDNQLLNVHFVDDLTLTHELSQHFVEGTPLCLDTFAEVVGAVVSEEITEAFLIS